MRKLWLCWGVVALLGVGCSDSEEGMTKGVGCIVCTPRPVPSPTPSPSPTPCHGDRDEGCNRGD